MNSKSQRIGIMATITPNILLVGKCWSRYYLPSRVVKIVCALLRHYCQINIRNGLISAWWWLKSIYFRAIEKHLNEIFEGLFYKLLEKCPSVPPSHCFKFKNPLYSLDSTAIYLCLSISPGRLRSGNGRALSNFINFVFIVDPCRLLWQWLMEKPMAFVWQKQQQTWFFTITGHHHFYR